MLTVRELQYTQLYGSLKNMELKLMTTTALAPCSNLENTREDRFNPMPNIVVKYYNRIQT